MVAIATMPKVIADEPGEVIPMDKARYFVILSLADKGVIYVEHYAFDNVLMHVIEGTKARVLFQTIIKNNWMTELSQAAYIGKELAKAKLSLQHGFKYLQDGA